MTFRKKKVLKVEELVEAGVEAKLIRLIFEGLLELMSVETEMIIYFEENRNQFDCDNFRH